MSYNMKIILLLTIQEDDDIAFFTVNSSIEDDTLNAGKLLMQTLLYLQIILPVNNMDDTFTIILFKRILFCVGTLSSEDSISKTALLQKVDVSVKNSTATETASIEAAASDAQVQL